MANHLSESLPERTFQYQSSLPPLPVPSLEISLSKYLDAGRLAALYCTVLFIAHSSRTENSTLYKLFTNAAAVPLYFCASLQGVQFFDCSVPVPLVRPFASEKEFEATVNTVRKFQEGVGKELHQKLLQRAKIKRNWVCSYNSPSFLPSITDLLFTHFCFLC